MVHRRQVLSLREFDSRGFPVTSLYLNVDGRQRSRQQYLIALKDLLRVQEAFRSAGPWTLEQQKSLTADGERISRFVWDEFEPAGTKGLVIFACSAQGLWQVFLLPQPVSDLLRVETRPYLRPLSALLGRYHRCGIIVADRARARLLVSYLGEVVEQAAIAGDVPPQIRGGGRRHGREERQIERHVENHVRWHLQHVVEKTQEFHERKPFDRLVLGGRPEIVEELEKLLPPPLRRLVSGHFMTEVSAPAEEIQAAAEEVDRDYDRRQNEQLVQRIEDETNIGRLGVLGLAGVLEALNLGAVHILAVAPDLRLPGVVCDQCGFLGTRETKCPRCGAEATRTVEDIVTEAIGEAVEGNCEVAFVEGNEKLSAAGGLGALLRFRWE